MNDLKVPPTDQRRITAIELRRLPEDERTAILQAQAILAEGYYRDDRQLTDFEAFGEDDLHGDSCSTEAG